MEFTVSSGFVVSAVGAPDICAIRIANDFSDADRTRIVGITKVRGKEPSFCGLRDIPTAELEAGLIAWLTERGYTITKQEV